MVQDDLFGDLQADDRASGAPFAANGKASMGAILPAVPDTECEALAQALHARWDGRLRLGTSSWHFPGWAGLVWDRSYPAARLSQEGLRAYARHPLLRCVSLDRAFYRPLDAAGYAKLGTQVDDDFRFVVKAPSLVTDAQRRDARDGRALGDNASFLDPQLAVDLAARPALEGLGLKLGALVFQLSPLPSRWLDDEPALHARLDSLMAPVAEALAGRAVAALELRDPSLLTPSLASLMRAHGWRACLGLHDRMPGLEQQLPMQRALWPGDLVCRWNLQRGLRYAEARDSWAPFDRLQAEDLPTRQALARVARATLDAGHRVTITINNKAEGSAPESVMALARALA